MIPKRIFHFLVQQFCKPEDSIETKRQQCVLVSTSLLLLLFTSLALIHSAVFGTLSSNYLSVMIMLLVMAFIVMHCKLTRTSQSSRLLCLALLYFCFHLLYQRGAFARMPHLAVIGLFAPMLSLFLGFKVLETILWFLAYLIGVTILHGLQLRGLLPSVVISDPTTLSWANFVTFQLLGLSHAIHFFFIAWIYASEVETRQSLQKELHLFVRLSHEIRTPVTIITGIAEIMSEWKLTIEQKSNLSDLATAARRLGHVVNDLLAFTEETSQDLLAESTQFNLREVIDIAVGYHIAQAEASMLTVYIDLPSAVPFDVQGARNRLLCILDQLIGNAIKFTPSGSVTIQVELVAQNPISVQETREVKFIVRDTGMGMTLKDLEGIFHPFVQTDVGPTRLFDGIGLGLTIAQRMIKMWGPDRVITAESAGPNRGSTFSFVVPLKPATGPSAFRMSSLHPTPNLLVVDDDKTSSNGMLQLCAALGVDTQLCAYSDFSEEKMKVTAGILFSIHDGELTIGECIQTTVEGLVDRAHRTERSQQLPPLLLVIAAPSSYQRWCEETLKCRFVRQPPALSRFKGVLRPLTHPLSLANATNRGPNLSVPGHSNSSPLAASVNPHNRLSFTTPSINSPNGRPHPGAPAPALSVLVTDVCSISTGTESYQNSPAIEAPHALRILCVDDSAVILKLLTAFIGKAGFSGEVDTATSGEEAIRMAIENTYVLIFMDFNMPGLNGADTTLRLRQAHREMPIVGLTAAPMVRGECLEAGMNEVIFKPFTVDTIERVIKSHIF